MRRRHVDNDLAQASGQQILQKSTGFKLPDGTEYLLHSDNCSHQAYVWAYVWDYVHAARIAGSRRQTAVVRAGQMEGCSPCGALVFIASQTIEISVLAFCLFTLTSQTRAVVVEQIKQDQASTALFLAMLSYRILSKPTRKQLCLSYLQSWLVAARGSTCIQTITVADQCLTYRLMIRPF